MPRIPETELERLKREVSLVRLIESQGHELKKRGRDWVMRCVFHEEDTPSLSVSEAKNVYHCFGCNASGTVLDWVMKTQGVSLPHAVQLLRNDAPLAGAEKVGVNRSQARHLPSLAAGSDEAVLLREVADTYHATLKQSPEAQAYLVQRGLVHGELIDTFRLGYANKSLTYRLPPGYSKEGRDVRAKLQRVGVYRESGHEHLNGCLVVPVFDLESGDGVVNVRQMYGRRIAPGHKIPAGQPKHLYLSLPLAGVWNEVALVASREVIVCEALIDALTFWCAGYRNVIAAYGVNGFTQDHWDALKRHGTERVWIAYDRDDAGNSAAEKLGTELREVGIETWRVLFPKGMDANDYARKVAPAEKSLGVLLQQAEWIGKGKRPAVAAQVEPVPVEEVTDVQPASSLVAIAVPGEAVTPATEMATKEEVQPAQTDELDVKQTEGGELLFTFGERVWRIRGWQKNLGPEQMRVNAQVRRGETYHVDTLDVYSAKARGLFLKAAAVELGSQEDTLKRDLGRVLLKLETLQDEAIRTSLAPKEKGVTLDAVEHAAALEWLKAPDLIARLEADMARCGVVGEATNLLAGYLSAVSRKLDAPLAVLIQSSSAAGKSSLMDAVLDLMPDEERIQYSAMTGQSLFYLGETDLQHKILAIAEEEGVRQAAYALKLLQSDGELTIASTGKDEATGNLVTKQYRVKGPVMLMLTTTAIDVDEELLNRCLVLTINESREQTREIHARQRAKQTLEGLLAETDKQHIVELHRNAQRLLKPVHVVNPYAEQLTFMDDKTRMRRDHMKYLTLIRSIALLHQYQRPHRTVTHRGEALTYIEVTKADIALANRIAHEVLGRTLDELPPQTRRLLTMVQAWVNERCTATAQKQNEFRFTRRDVREATRWGDTQLKVHLARLVELEYVLTHRGLRGLTHEYELRYDGVDDGRPHLMGLLELQTLDNDANRSGQNEERSGSGRVVGGGRSEVIDQGQGHAVQGMEAEPVGVNANAYIGEKTCASSLARVVEDSR
ncbi:DNA primase [Paraburkholderia domus]|jgi:DNA primase (bacterial type)|uniref:CHC2 zinc finger domain-containing protein n=1 Tax=Paraburkholderia domus TaxID=2793075 RepID=UPI001912D3F8|nr:CHC2 zinc finger domain-containing protein [Paraburkholderia domus]MBK5050824.1 toprim domain-containing protein [Burkholderia sp. R-70006]MBK5050830.1 toprim domain-containing protein [Burkholderia sp. R-70006]CAE6765269.1 DNA primase [Paraburkholderia domus]CAE6765428.1 DNA primase [Paraburkholderia domus]